MAPDELGPSSPTRWRRWIALGLIFIGLTCVAFWTHAPYLSLPPAHDDRFLQLVAGLKDSGRMGWPVYLLSAYEGHFIPAWRAVYLTQMQTLGANFVAWHVAELLVQSVSALLLYVLLARYLRDRAAALTGAVLWAGAAIGHWDNQHAWIAAGAYVHALAWLLAAMWAVARYADTRGGMWLTAIVLALGVATCFSGHALLLAPVLLLQAAWLEPDTWRARRRSFILAWAAGVAIFGAVQFLSVALSGVPSSFQVGSLLNLGSVARTVVSQLLASFEHLAGLGLVDPRAWPPLWQRVAVVVGLAAVFFLPRVNRRVLVVFGLLGIVHLLSARALRGELPPEAALGWGRYLYESTLSWCVAASAVLAAARQWAVTAGAVARSTVAGICVVLCLVALVRQRALAAVSAEEHRRVTRGQREQVEANVAALRWLDAHAAGQGTTLRVPDIPLEVPPAVDTYYPLSVFLAANVRGRLPHLAVVRIDRASAEDWERWNEALTACPLPVARRWAAAGRPVAEWIAAVRWLDDAGRRGTPLHVPNTFVPHPPARYPLRQLIAFSLSDWPSGVRIDEPRARTRAGWQSALDDIRRLNGPYTAFWETVFAPVVGAPATAAPGDRATEAQAPASR